MWNISKSHKCDATSMALELFFFLNKIGFMDIYCTHFMVGKGHITIFTEKNC